jgi:hypothetical protein
VSPRTRADPQIHLKLSVRSGDGDGHVVSHDLRSDHSKGLALGRVDLSGHDGRPRLVLWQTELSKSTSRSRSEVSDVVGDLHEGAGEDVERTRGLDDGIVGGESLKLVGSGVEGESRNLGDLEGDLDVESLAGVESSADSSTSLGEERQSREDALDSIDSVGDLLDVSRELLPEGEGRRVLKMCSSDLDDVVELELLGVHGGVELLEGGDQGARDLDDGRDVHRRREGVVGRLAHVDVVVGVHGRLGSELSSEELDGTVGNDLQANPSESSRSSCTS